MNDYGGVLLHIFNSNAFKSTSNSDTLEKQKYHYVLNYNILVVFLNASLLKMRKSTVPCAYI